MCTGFWGGNRRERGHFGGTTHTVVFENRVLRRILGPKREEVTGNGENYIKRSLMICTANPVLFG